MKPADIDPRRIPSQRRTGVPGERPVFERINPEDAPREVIQPLRRFYQPLGSRITPEWRIGGMAAWNVAFFLMQPQVLFTEYERNKNNPPRKVFVRAPQSEINFQTDVDEVVTTDVRRQNKLHDAVRAAALIEGKRQRTKENSTPAVGVSDIQVEDSPLVIQTESVPPDFKEVLRKQAAPDDLINQLRYAESEKVSILAQFNAARKAKAPDLKQWENEKRKIYYRIKSLKQEIEQYAEGKHGGVYKTIAEKVSEGYSFGSVTIPPCPEGSYWRFERRLVEPYIRRAFGPEPIINPAGWEYVWTEFENSVIRCAWEMRLFEAWPNDSARSRWVVDGSPRFEDWATGKNYAKPPSFNNDPQVNVRQRESQAGYDRRPDGSMPDETIRHGSVGVDRSNQGGSTDPNRWARGETDHE